MYHGGSGTVIAEAFTDADWGSNTDDRRSVSGVMVLIGKAPVVSKSKYQRTVALSSAGAEYMARSFCTQEVLWVRAMPKDMGCEQVVGTRVWEDNQGAIALDVTLDITLGRSTWIFAINSFARTWNAEHSRSTTWIRKTNERTCLPRD